MVRLSDTLRPLGIHADVLDRILPEDQGLPTTPEKSLEALHEKHAVADSVSI